MKNQTGNSFFNLLNIKSLIFIVFVFISNVSMANGQAHVFVSFSMPKKLFIETLKEAKELNLPVYIKGFYQNSMKLTAEKIMEFTKDVPDLNLQIDPTLFEKYDIQKVPAVVCDNGEAFDVIYGNLKIREALNRIAESNNGPQTVHKNSGSKLGETGLLLEKTFRGRV